MSRHDPGTSTGQPIREPRMCKCGDSEALHKIGGDGSRGRCSSSACGCRTFRDKGSIADILDALVAERFGHVMPPDLPRSR